MMNVEYTYYHDTYVGTKIPEASFEKYSAIAQRFIGYVTSGKVHDNVIDKIRNAVCAAADACFEVEQRYVNISPGIKSENTDGYSVTYSDYAVSDIINEQDRAMYRAVQRELSGTGLLYRGMN